MNITVNDVGPCKKLLRVELGETEVAQAFAEVEKDYQKHAHLPGFRKGKAPKEMILKSFDHDLKEEAKRKLISESYRNAVKEQNLSVYSLVNVEEVQFERGKPMQYVATVEVFPTFELPAYKGLAAKREDRSVTEADIDHAIELLRGRHATFLTVDREAKQGDIVVANYTGTCEGKPISELAPASRGLATQQNYWIEIKEGAFIPGFANQLVGAKAASKRTVNVDFPADFASEPLAGKKASYEVEVVEVKERLLPPLDDAFAKSWEANDLKGLREGVRQDLQNELNDKLNRSVRNQVVQSLLSPMQFDMPESAVLAETRNVVYEMVRENQQRGVSKEIIDKNKDEIFNAANAVAKERTKAGFVFNKIAEKEGIKVQQQELDARIFSMAKSMEMTVEKLVKELEKRQAIEHIAEQILNDKVIDLLQLHAKIEDISAPVANV
ncbi:MAG: trigger factor [Verrucomicrobia bacterium]|nr:trigger factor [Verrucomicrobiota bacterium]